MSDTDPRLIADTVRELHVWKEQALRTLTALEALWEWAQPQGIERHAEDGDTIAAAIVSLVRGVLIDGSMCGEDPRTSP